MITIRTAASDELRVSGDANSLPLLAPTTGPGNPHSTGLNESKLPSGTPAFASAPISRRGFLGVAGFSMAALGTLTGCTKPSPESLVPYLAQTPEMQPGQSQWYATVCPGCSAGCGALVKVRDGRPIKLEGNPDHPLSRGGLCAAGQASLIGLYDSSRFSMPKIDGRKVSWSEFDGAVRAALAIASANQGKVRVLSSTIASTSERAQVERLLSSHADARLVEYDPVSYSAIAAAHELTHGVRAIPHYRFDRASVIASFDADFLGTWLSPVEFTAQYMARRDPDSPSRYSWHGQYEAALTTTGARADSRFAMNPAELRAALLYLAGLLGESGLPEESLAARTLAEMDRLAVRLRDAHGHGLIVCGLQDLAVQQAVNAINHHLGHYGTTVDLAHPSHQRVGDDTALQGLLAELSRGEVEVLLINNANPVYDLPNGAEFARWIENTAFVAVLAERPDETTVHADAIAALSHPLESWSDNRPLEGLHAIRQPVIRPLGDTRSPLAVFAAWSGDNRSDRQIVHESHESLPLSTRESNHESLPLLASTTGLSPARWTETLHRGFFGFYPGGPIESANGSPAPFNAHVSPDQPSWRGVQSPSATSRDSHLDNRGAWHLALYTDTTVPDARAAENPFLLELPDPISKISWDNFAAVSPASARELGVGEGAPIAIHGGGETSITLPVHIQPGLADRTVAVALNYGRASSARFTDAGPQWIQGGPSTGANGLVGVSAAPLLAFSSAGHLIRHRSDIRVSPAAGDRVEFAKAQEYDFLDVPTRLTPPDGGRRDMVIAASLGTYVEHPESIRHPVNMEGDKLWPEDHPKTGHHWGMAIDLNKCTGCSGCVVSCQIENNVPVVGRDEVRRNRELHWLRIDRYFEEDQHGQTQAHFQPVMCQQCDNAPCETVCPVLATVHSEEGLNQQVYNRCVGTRYCANNCPYKMRRFNWFDYPRGDEQARLTLNPDVTVRSRGIMEKCTFCVQRIQEAKIAAKRDNRSLSDGEIKPACQQSCPAGAIVFGDMNDPASEIYRLMNSKRSYTMLEELNVRPSVNYLAVIRNSAGGGGEVHHG